MNINSIFKGKIVKVFITKYAISRGIIESGEGEIREDKSFYVTGKKNSYTEKEYCLTIEEATIQTRDLLDTKIKRLKKSIGKLQDHNIKLISNLGT